MTPIYHPNISEIGMVCLGAYGTHWVPSLALDELCVMLWDMARYQNYDIRSPYNREAALWTANQTTFRFPIDPRPLRDLRAAARPDRVAPSRPRHPAVDPTATSSDPRSSTWRSTSAPATSRARADRRPAARAARRRGLHRLTDRPRPRWTTRSLTFLDDPPPTPGPTPADRRSSSTTTTATAGSA